MGEPGRNHDQIPCRKGEDFAPDLYAHIPFQKKIEFIVAMRMQQHLRACGVAVIVQLKVPGDHVLPGAELGLKFLFHKFSLFPGP